MTGPGSRKASNDGKKLRSKSSSKSIKSTAGKGLNKHKQESHSGSKKQKDTKNRNEVVLPDCLKSFFLKK